MNLLDKIKENETFDTRSNHGKRFSSKEFLLFVIMAKLSGANTNRKISNYIHENKRSVSDLLAFTWISYPKKDAVCRFLNKIKTEDLQKIINMNLFSNKFHFAVDGKTTCSSGINTLNVFCQETLNAIGSTYFEKGKEIAAVYNLFVLNNFEPDSWITLDALHTQKKHMN